MCMKTCSGFNKHNTEASGEVHTSGQRGPSGECRLKWEPEAYSHEDTALTAFPVLNKCASIFVLDDHHSFLKTYCYWQNKFIILKKSPDRLLLSLKTDVLPFSTMWMNLEGTVKGATVGAGEISSKDTKLQVDTPLPC